MNLSNYFWYFKSALTPRFCDEVIKYALEKKETIAIPKKRVSRVIGGVTVSIVKLYHFLNHEGRPK